MMEPHWLSRHLVGAIHAEAVALFGGVAGLRDEGLLESALQRPRDLFAYGEAPSLFQLAACYCAGLVKNHPFLDGNKRAGYLAAHVFLELNGYAFAPPEPEIATMIIALTEGSADEPALAAWFSDYAVRRQA